MIFSSSVVFMSEQSSLRGFFIVPAVRGVFPSNQTSVWSPQTSGCSAGWEQMKADGVTNSWRGDYGIKSSRDGYRSFNDQRDSLFLSAASEEKEKQHMKTSFSIQTEDDAAEFHWYSYECKWDNERIYCRVRWKAPTISWSGGCFHYQDTHPSRWQESWWCLQNLNSKSTNNFYLSKTASWFMITYIRFFVVLSVMQSEYLLYKCRWYVGYRMSLVWKN